MAGTPRHVARPQGDYGSRNTLRLLSLLQDDGLEGSEACQKDGFLGLLGSKYGPQIWTCICLFLFWVGSKVGALTRRWYIMGM